MDSDTVNDHQENEVSRQEAEADRRDAEGERVVAEGERRYAESNEETGRREAEANRQLAERTREKAHSRFEDELARLQEDPAHYMTPGARAYFRRVMLGYIILAIAASMGIWAFSQKAADQVRTDINVVAKAQCLGSIPTLKKYNSLVEIMIESNRGSRAIALKERDFARVTLTTSNIVKLQKAYLRVPSPKECDAPLLKE